MREPLTNRRQEWAKQFKAKVLEGPPLETNAGVAEWYAKKLEGLVREMHEQTSKELEHLFTHGPEDRPYSQDASNASQARILLNRLKRVFQRKFARKAEDLAEGMIACSTRAGSASAHMSLKELSGGLSLKTSPVSGALKEKLKASVHDNVSLIRGLQQDYYVKVEGTVMRSITTGNGLMDLVPQLEKMGGMSRQRAHFIALDQTRKANAVISRQKLTEAGVEYFRWVHSSRSKKPRSHHRDVLNGQLFRFDDPPVIDPDTGETGFPGQLINCRCRMKPVIKFDKKEGESE